MQDNGIKERHGIKYENSSLSIVLNGISRTPARRLICDLPKQLSHGMAIYHGVTPALSSDSSRRSYKGMISDRLECNATLAVATKTPSCALSTQQLSLITDMVYHTDTYRCRAPRANADTGNEAGQDSDKTLAVRCCCLLFPRKRTRTHTDEDTLRWTALDITHPPNSSANNDRVS